MTDKPCAVYEIRTSSNLIGINDYKKLLSKYAKKWVFQKEQGEQTGYLHYQGRISLIKKKSLSRFKKLLFQNDDLQYFQNIIPTITAEHRRESFYTMKVDTRIEGPFKDDDPIEYCTKQLEIFKTYELRPYQQQIIELTKDFNLRTIYLIYDNNGNSGKSLLAEYLETNLKNTEEIPPFRLMEDIFQWVCTRPIKQNYIVDMPRGMKKDKLGEFYSGIEVIKNGVAYDKRYNAKKIRFDRPNIFVFTNTLPKFELLSIDRWKVYEITKDYEFEQLEPLDYIENKEEYL